MTSALFDGLASLAVSVFSEDVIYSSTDTTLSAKVSVDFVEVDDGETYREIHMLHFSTSDLEALDITLSINDIITVRGDDYRVLDTSTTGRGMLQCRMGEVVS